MIAEGQHGTEGVPAGDAPELAELAPFVEPPPVEECGEPLVELAESGRIRLLNLYFATGWSGTDRRVWLRESVARALGEAVAGLPDGFGLAVFDGWRSPETVRALYDHFYGPGSTLRPGFLADPDEPGAVPPHLTGAAVDLTLTWEGRALALGTYFDDFTPRAARRALEDDPAEEPARSLRRLLHHHLGAAGFVGVAEEWWHVSMGDQRWAVATGAPCARFGPVEPR